MRLFLKRLYNKHKIIQIIYDEVFVETLFPLSRCFFFVLFFPISLTLRLLRFRVAEIDLNMGNVCTLIDSYAVDQLIKNTIPFRLIIYPYARFRFKTVNDYLFKLWKQHFFVITNRLFALIFYFVFTSPWLKLSHSYFAKQEGKSHYAAKRAYWLRQAEFSKETALLKIPHADQSRGWEILSKFGLKKGDWFVCFFAREPGYYDSVDYQNQGIIRNVDVRTYREALTEIIRRGGWCIRMGASKMDPLPQEFLEMPKVIDYPKSPHVSDFMDIFLASSCKFMITCASGISFLPGLFGVPIVATNLITFNEAICPYPKDISILKRFYSKKMKRYLTFPEIFNSYVVDHCLFYFFESMNLDLIPNTSEEICEATREMLDRLENSYNPEMECRDLQEKFKESIHSCMYCKESLGKIGDHFLKTHAHLLQ